jgi:hypothetical protein
MRISFAPFGPQEATALSAATTIDFTATDFSSEHWLCVAGRDDDGVLAGVACFEFKTWFDAYFNIAVRDPRCVSRRVMRAMFKAVFSRAVRVSAEIEPGNERALRQALLMGFEIEGYKRFALDGRRDALQLGMTSDTCRYLRARQRAPQPAKHGEFHGQLSEAA